MNDRTDTTRTARPVIVPIGRDWLLGDLTLPAGASGLIVFAHGSGSTRRSPRNQYVAHCLQARGLATLLIDLLTPDEEAVDRWSSSFRFDIPMLAGRLVAVIDWLRHLPDTAAWPLGLFGASTGAAAALIAAAERPNDVMAVVSRDGRPDLARAALPRVEAPTLMLVGSLDEPVIQMNREARAGMLTGTSLEIVQGATHLFEEPGMLEHVAERAGDWFLRYLTNPAHRTRFERHSEEAQSCASKK
jgi:putative phosphoribosyl transferase